ncbi:MAG: hypothetical protein LBI42_15845 [Chitinispirillales bacterium]|nr:hypothetical protein [Chitinispirillales bacterium]
MEDGSCRYQWLLDLERSSVNKLPDSMIYNLSGTMDMGLPARSIRDRNINNPFSASGENCRCSGIPSYWRSNI